MSVLATFATVSGSLKTAAETVKGLINLRDEAVFRSKAIELQGQISAALADAIAAYESQMAQLQKVQGLEKEVADLKTWNAEKDRYELVALAPNVVAFAIKESMRGSGPDHYLCANCFTKGNKAYLQQVTRGQYHDKFRCNECEEELSINKGTPPIHNSRPGGGNWMGN